MSSPPDYYAILEIASTATEQDIKRAYKKAALKWHPDRVPVDSPERTKRTKRFQAINDAYYTLSDATRRRDYDEARRFHSTTFTDDEDADEDIPRRTQPGSNTWSSFFSNFGRSGNGNQEEKFSNDQFESAFAEMMGEASMADGAEQEAGSPHPKPGSFWAMLGGLSGATLGFIFANFAGAIPGAAAGWKFGRLRDEKKQPVYNTFQQLPQGDKAKLLSELAQRLFASALGS